MECHCQKAIKVHSTGSVLCCLLIFLTLSSVHRLSNTSNCSVSALGEDAGKARQDDSANHKTWK